MTKWTVTSLLVVPHIVYSLVKEFHRRRCFADIIAYPDKLDKVERPIMERNAIF